MKSRVTSKDVAKCAGVSQATVSYVLNDVKSQSISKKTRDKVLHAAKELKYFPSNAAKVLRSNKTNCICVVINKNLMEVRYSQNLQGIRDVMDSNGYDIILYSEQRSSNAFVNYINSYFEQRFDGIIYIGADGKTPQSEVQKAVREHHIPFVALDCNISDDSISSVDIDYADGAFVSTRYLLQNGFLTIVYLTPDRKTHQETERCKGVKRALDGYPKASLIVDRLDMGNRGADLLFWNADTVTMDNYYDLISKRVKKSVQGDLPGIEGRFGIICSWSSMVSGTISALKDANADAPVVSLASNSILRGFSSDNITFAYSELPNVAAGRTAAQALLDHLENGRITKLRLKPTFISQFPGSNA